MEAASTIFNKTYLKVIRKHFFNMCFVIKRWTGKLNFFSERMEDIQQKRQNQIFRIERGASTKVLSLAGSLDIDGDLSM